MYIWFLPKTSAFILYAKHWGRVCPNLMKRPTEQVASFRSVCVWTWLNLLERNHYSFASLSPTSASCLLSASFLSSAWFHSHSYYEHHFQSQGGICFCARLLKYCMMMMYPREDVQLEMKALTRSEYWAVAAEHRDRWIPPPWLHVVVNDGIRPPEALWMAEKVWITAERHPLPPKNGTELTDKTAFLYSKKRHFIENRIPSIIISLFSLLVIIYCYLYDLFTNL